MTPDVFQILLFVALVGGGSLSLFFFFGGFALGHMLGKKA